MEDYSNYRETPRTGRAPDQSMHELDPELIDPSVLIDDRGNPDLLAFEKTWGHRVLAGLGVAMFVISIALVAYSIIQLVRVADVAAVLPDVGMVGMVMWGVVLVGAMALLPPAAIAIYVAKHPRNVAIAIVFAIIALVVVVVFFMYAVIATPQYLFAACLYGLLLALLPAAYLIAALKIKRSN